MNKSVGWQEGKEDKTLPPYQTEGKNNIPSIDSGNKVKR